VGAGLTPFILVLATATTRRPSSLPIDEPELSLHPSQQLDFATTLTSWARAGVLFATQPEPCPRGRLPAPDPAVAVLPLRLDDGDGCGVHLLPDIDADRHG
jgi:hypothetical protein